MSKSYIQHGDLGRKKREDERGRDAEARCAELAKALDDLTNLAGIAFGRLYKTDDDWPAETRRLGAGVAKAREALAAAPAREGKPCDQTTPHEAHDWSAQGVVSFRCPGAAAPAREEEPEYEVALEAADTVARWVHATLGSQPGHEARVAIEAVRDFLRTEAAPSRGVTLTEEQAEQVAAAIVAVPGVLSSKYRPQAEAAIALLQGELSQSLRDEQAQDDSSESTKEPS